jgi:hypothetical protein
MRLTGGHAPRGIAAAEHLHALDVTAEEWENMWIIMVNGG